MCLAIRAIRPDLAFAYGFVSVAAVWHLAQFTPFLPVVVAVAPSVCPLAGIMSVGKADPGFGIAATDLFAMMNAVAPKPHAKTAKDVIVKKKSPKLAPEHKGS